MDWQEIERRLLDSLYRELRGHWGRISEIEERLGVSGGYLAKLCAGRNEIKLGLFLHALEHLDSLRYDHADAVSLPDHCSARLERRFLLGPEPPTAR